MKDEIREIRLLLEKKNMKLSSPCLNSPEGLQKVRNSEFDVSYNSQIENIENENENAENQSNYNIDNITDMEHHDKKMDGFSYKDDYLLEIPDIFHNHDISTRLTDTNNNDMVYESYFIYYTEICHETKLLLKQCVDKGMPLYIHYLYDFI